MRFLAEYLRIDAWSLRAAAVNNRLFGWSGLFGPEHIAAAVGLAVSLLVFVCLLGIATQRSGNVLAAFVMELLYLAGFQFFEGAKVLDPVVPAAKKWTPREPAEVVRLKAELIAELDAAIMRFLKPGAKRAEDSRESLDSCDKNAPSKSGIKQLEANSRLDKTWGQGHLPCCAKLQARTNAAISGGRTAAFILVMASSSEVAARAVSPANRFFRASRKSFDQR
jgi:hypothetical protein